MELTITKGATLPPTAWLTQQQIPPLPKYAGELEGVDGESFQDWKDQFELVARVCQWDSQMELANLVTRLRGQAYAFCRSCSPATKASYDALVAELTRRFVPVRIQSVQSSLFYEWKQATGETVEAYTQDLRKLFNRAYPQKQRGTREAETMAQSVLASEFAAGLRSAIKMKVAGTEGRFEQLLVKARFEEAKLCDLGDLMPSKSFHKPSPKQPAGGSPQGTQQVATSGRDRGPQARFEGRSKTTGGNRCFHCGDLGHYAKQCPQRGRSKSNKAPGRGCGTTVTQLGMQTEGQQGSPATPGRVADLQKH